VDVWVAQFLDELRTALFLTGSANLNSLQTRPRVITGNTRAWIDQLGYA
jgi:isopentenyl diphosphate isomerase/L-lactate dehydrogenase-like FMN-dependent dehydrogenase